MGMASWFEKTHVVHGARRVLFRFADALDIFSVDPSSEEVEREQDLLDEDAQGMFAGCVWILHARVTSAMNTQRHSRAKTTLCTIWMTCRSERQKTFCWQMVNTWANFKRMRMA